MRPRMQRKGTEAQYIRVRDMQNMQKLADHMVSCKLLEKPEEEMVSNLKRVFQSRP